MGGQGTSAALAQLYVGRIIGGFGVGVSSAVIPTYIAECSPRTCRGRISGMYQLLYVFIWVLTLSSITRRGCLIFAFVPFSQSSNVTGIMLSFFVNYGLVENATDIESPHLWRVSFAWVGVGRIECFVAVVEAIFPFSMLSTACRCCQASSTCAAS